MIRALRHEMIAEDRPGRSTAGSRLAESAISVPGACRAAITQVPGQLTGTISGSRGRPNTPVDPDVASMVLACAVAVILFLLATVALRVVRIRSLFEEGRESRPAY